MIAFLLVFFFSSATVDQVAGFVGLRIACAQRWIRCQHARQRINEFRSSTLPILRSLRGSSSGDREDDEPSSKLDRELVNIEQALRRVEKEIAVVEEKIDDADAQFRAAPSDTLKSLWGAKEQGLRAKEQGLRAEKRILLEQRGKIEDDRRTKDRLLLQQRVPDKKLTQEERLDLINTICEFVGEDREAFFRHEFSAETGGAHIVAERFPYAKREREEMAVVESFKRRQRKRNKVRRVSVGDKILNHLTSVPGAPGIGKSTFMVHFPESAPYLQYLNGSRSIVSICSFNSMMESEKDAIFGVRALYGAIAAMSVCSADKSWGHFSKIMIPKLYGKSLPLDEIMSILLELYYDGKTHPNCRLLFLVDEISKSWDDKEVISHLCGALSSSNCEVDVLVSALSPSYVSTLLTGSQRPIEYVVLSPLLDEGLGKEEIRSAMRDYRAKVIDPFTKNAFDNLHLLASGHPRTIELFVEELYERAELSFFRDLTMDPSLTAVRLMVKTAGTFFVDRSPSGTDLSSVLENLVLNPLPLRVDDSAFREYLEKGYILALSTAKASRFKAVLRLSSFIDAVGARGLLSDLELSKYPRCQAAVTLFEDVTQGSMNSCRPISDWWERAVLLTIACRAKKGEALSDSVGSSKGFGCNAGPVCVRSVSTVKQFISPGSAMDELRLAPPNFPGVDGLILLTNTEGQRLRNYLQMKISWNKLKSLASIIATSINNTLRNVPRCESIPLKYTLFVFYIWSDAENLGCSVMKDAVLQELYMIHKKRAQKEEIEVKGEHNSGKGEIVGMSDAEIVKYVEDFFESNVRILLRAELDQWLLPTLRVVPRLVEAVEEDVEEEEEGC